MHFSIDVTRKKVGSWAAMLVIGVVLIVTTLTLAPAAQQGEQGGTGNASALDVTLTDLDGVEISLASFKGKIVRW